YGRALEDQDLRYDEDRPVDPPLQGDDVGEGILQGRALGAEEGGPAQKDHGGLARLQRADHTLLSRPRRKPHEEGEDAVQEAGKAADGGGDGEVAAREGPDEEEVVEDPRRAHHVDQAAAPGVLGQALDGLVRKGHRTEAAAHEPPGDRAETRRDGLRAPPVRDDAHAGVTYSRTLFSRKGKLIGFSKTPSTCAPHASSCPTDPSIAPEIT